MNILIIEDEHGAAQNLQAIIKEINSSIKILAIIETVQDTVNWIANNPTPNLAFFDIQLADGNSFEIFQKVKVEFPVIFTTAYDQYAIKAFKVNSVDYLLKPIQKQELEFALNKFRKIYENKETVNFDNLSKLISELGSSPKKKFRKTFLIHHQDRILPVSVSDFAFFFIKMGVVYGVTHQKEKYCIEQTLESIEEEINPDEFYRANRQYIVSRKGIKEAAHYFNGRLKLKITPTPKDEILISKAKVAEFKEWLGG